MMILSELGYDWATFEKVGQVSTPYYCTESTIKAAENIFLRTKTEEDEIALVSIWVQAREDCQKAIKMPKCLNRQRAKIIALHYLTQGTDLPLEISKRLLERSLDPTVREVGKILEAGASRQFRPYSYEAMVAWTRLWTVKYLPFRW